MELIHIAEALYAASKIIIFKLKLICLLVINNEKIDKNVSVQNFIWPNIMIIIKTKFMIKMIQ